MKIVVAVCLAATIFLWVSMIFEKVVDDLILMCANIIIDRRKAWVMPESKYSIGGIKNGYIHSFFTMKEVLQMPNTELPIDLETQVMLMKKYVNFRQRKKMREFLRYAGYFKSKSLWKISFNTSKCVWK